MDRKKFFKRIVYLIFFIFIVHFFANKFYWYSSIWYFDIIMHFLGGLWVGLFFIWFKKKPDPKSAQKMHNYVKIPNRRIPVEFICKEMNYKNEKDEIYDAFEKLFPVHSCII